MNAQDNPHNIDVLLVNAPEVFSEGAPGASVAVQHPLGVMCLASSLRAAGYGIAIIDCVAEHFVTIDHILQRMKKEKIPILGISATTPQIRGAYQLATAIKEVFGEEITVVLGGIHLSVDPGFLERFSGIFDIGVVGEGEITFTDIVKRLLDGEKVQGLHHGEIVKDLDALPWVARDLVNKSCYSQIPFKSEFTLMNTIRGCPFSCSFCSRPDYEREVRFRSVDSVMEEIRYCVNELGAKYICFQDDTLTLKKSRFVEICERIIAEGIKVKWGGATRANLVNDRIMKLMAEAGCIDLNFGIETGDDDFRAEIVKKGVTSEQITEAFRLASKYGIETGALCMLGFPGETKELMQKTVDLMKVIKADIFGFHITILMPGSDLYRTAVMEGKINPDIWDQYARGEITEQPCYIPDGLTREEMKKIQMDGYRSYYFTPGYLFRRFVRDMSSFHRFKNDLLIGVNLLFSRGTGTGRV